MNRLRVASIIPSRTAGGIGPVCYFAADALARQTGWEITLLSLHDPPDTEGLKSGLKLVSLGLEENCSSSFLRWLNENPQDAIISSGVSQIEPAFPYVPDVTRHIVLIHDCLRQYHRVVLTNFENLDGVVCVAHHIERILKGPLNTARFAGIIRTIHNGASFPPIEPRPSYDGPLRLLFLGRTDPFKGVSDLPLILKELRRIGVSATLSIVGPVNEDLKGEFARCNVSDSVVWTGVLPHHECFQQAATSDLLLMPSRKEPFGMVTIEAMSMGCVPMAYDVVSGSTEIIQQSQTGILTPLGNIREWARQIRSLDKDRERLKELSRNAAEDARRRFNSDRMGSELKTFINDVMQRERSSLKRLSPESFSESPAEAPAKPSGYQMISPRIRELIRREIGKKPRFCNWILNRL